MWNFEAAFFRRIIGKGYVRKVGRGREWLKVVIMLIR